MKTDEPGIPQTRMNSYTPLLKHNMRIWSDVGEAEASSDRFMQEEWAFGKGICVNRIVQLAPHVHMTSHATHTQFLFQISPFSPEVKSWSVRINEQLSVLSHGLSAYQISTNLKFV